MKRLRIEVLQYDIDWGTRGHSGKCAAQRAIARTVPDAARIEVDTQTIRFTVEGKRWCYLTPLRVQQYVSDFDAGLDIEPFGFELRDPIQLRRRVVPDEVRPDYNAAVARRKKARREQTASVVHVAATPYAGVTSRVTVAGRIPPPRVFKTVARSYGHRVLRWNQPKPD